MCVCEWECGKEKETQRGRERSWVPACVCVWQCDLLLPHKHIRHTQALSVPYSGILSVSPSHTQTHTLPLSLSPLVRSINKCLRSKLHTNWMTWPVYWLTDWLIDQSISFRLSVCQGMCLCLWVCVCGVHKKLITFKLAACLTFQYTGQVRRPFVLNLIKSGMLRGIADN